MKKCLAVLLAFMSILSFTTPITAESTEIEPENAAENTASVFSENGLSESGLTLDSKNVILGDVNADGKVSVSDATRIQRYAAKLCNIDGSNYDESPLTQKELLTADVNADGKVSVTDATRIQRYAAKLCNLDGSTPYTDAPADEHSETEPPNQISSEAETSAETEAPVTLLATPVISKLENTTSGVKITWSAVAGAEKYRVFVMDGASWKKLGDTSSTTFVHTAAVSGTTYTYTVRCISSDGSAYTSGFYSSGQSVTYTKPSPSVYYWTPSGYAYHFTSDCPTLKRSTTIYSGSTPPSGRTPCSVCG